MEFIIELYLEADDADLFDPQYKLDNEKDARTVLNWYRGLNFRRGGLHHASFELLKNNKICCKYTPVSANPTRSELRELILAIADPDKEHNYPVILGGKEYAVMGWVPELQAF